MGSSSSFHLLIIKSTKGDNRRQDVTSCRYILSEISLHIFFSYSQHFFHSNHLFPTGLTLGAVYLKRLIGSLVLIVQTQFLCYFPTPRSCGWTSGPRLPFTPFSWEHTKSNTGQKCGCVKRGKSILTIAKELDFAGCILGKLLMLIKEKEKKKKQGFWHQNQNSALILKFSSLSSPTFLSPSSLTLHLVIALELQPLTGLFTVLGRSIRVDISQKQVNNWKDQLLIAR